MSPLVESWLQLQLLVVLGYGLTLAGRWLSPRDWQRLGRGLLLGALLLPLLTALWPAVPGAAGPIQPPVQLWHTGDITLQLPADITPLQVSAPVLERGFDLLALLALPALGVLLLGPLALQRRVAGTRLWRRLGGVELRRSPRESWALWLPGRTLIALDQRLDGPARQLALAHELQHHRNGDTRWAWLPLLLCLLSPVNPAAWAWLRLSRELDEFACDAALRPRFGSRDLALGLLQAAAPSPRQPALGMSSTHALLKRRILMLKRPLSPSRATLPALLLSFALFTGAAVAADDLVQGHHVSQQQLTELVSDTELSAHPLVQARLNRMVATAEGQAFYRSGLQRMDQHRPQVEAALARHGLPAELAALPLVESGYQQLAPGGPMMSAGAWQFIPATARQYGLQVDERVDHRLDFARETEAACQLLADLHGEFGDWGLALAAYNQGPGHLRASIDAHQTRDVYTLMERGALNDYVAYVHAGMVLSAHPELLD